MSKTTFTIDADNMSLFMTPEMQEILTPDNVKALKGFIGMVNDGLDVDKFFDIENALANHEVSAAQAAYVKSDPEVAKLFEERYIAPTPDIDELLKLPKDSLGFAYASNLRAANFEQGFYPAVDIKNDVDYLNLRVRQTHDIWHAVTGYLYDLDAGIKLAGFQVAQNRSTSMVMFLAALFLYTIKTNGDFNHIANIIKEGFDVGCQAKPFLAQKWEEAWEKPIAQWRAELNVTSVRD
ncbi:Coq4 family protein [Anabaena sp. PCC 7108]|uniref:Coq4 family protein n=1 Tax=Anabaena sp. PCC 7108 TaxID=163908 RepID=UPI00034DBFCF|nr:Coq4 family protein [Anabaena sp. PCC 7108]